MLEVQVTSVGNWAVPSRPMSTVWAFPPRAPLVCGVGSVMCSWERHLRSRFLTAVFGAECPAGTFGAGCRQSCLCGGAPCDRRTGQCLCLPGWTGHDCGQGEEAAAAPAPR